MLFKEVVKVIVKESKVDSVFDKNKVMMMLLVCCKGSHNWMKQILYIFIYI